MPLLLLIHKPLYQALLYMVLTVVVTFILRPKSADTLWVAAGISYSLFIVTNAVCVFFVMDTWPYFFTSLGISLLYLGIIAVIVHLLVKMFKLEGSEESAMIFLVIIFHPLVLLLAIFFKWMF